MGGALVNLPNPVKPTKQTTPVAPPMADKLVNVPKQQGRVVNKVTQGEADQIVQNNDAFGAAATRPFYNPNDPALAAILQREVDLFEKINDPKIKMRYQREIQIQRSLDADADLKPSTAKRQAARYLTWLYTTALQTGLKPEVLGDVEQEVLDDILDLQMEAIVANTTPERSAKKEAEMRKTIRSMDVPTQRTLLSLAPGWTGSYDELINAARSLSK
jgi:hypothetical protein